jgi:hypothetical protein
MEKLLFWEMLPPSVFLPSIFEPNLRDREKGIGGLLCLPNGHS